MTIFATVDPLLNLILTGLLFPLFGWIALTTHKNGVRLAAIDERLASGTQTHERHAAEIQALRAEVAHVRAEVARFELDVALVKQKLGMEK